MFDKLEDIILRLEEIHQKLSMPETAADSAQFQKLMKEEAELSPVAETYTAYKKQSRP